MDIDQIFETLDWFSEWFPRLEGKIAIGTTGNEAICATAFRFEELLVILAIFRGRRGGLREELFVVDPAREPKVDQLRVTHGGKNVVTTPFLDPRDMKKKIAAEGGSFLKAAAEHIGKVIDLARENPNGHFRTCLLDETYSSDAVTFDRWSIRTFRG